MSKSNERNCKHCGTLYTHKYTSKDGTPYHEQVEYCSKSCASKARGNVGCIKADIGSAALRDKALQFISEKNEYCSKDEICKGVGHSSKTFTKHGIRFLELNRELGFIKPKSKFQDKIENILKDSFDGVETEKSFDGLVGTKGHPLRVDFYIPEIDTIVEADGNQHSDPNHPWAKWKNGTVSEYDSIKDKFFKEKGMKVVRIPYKRSLKESDVVSRLI